MIQTANKLRSSGYKKTSVRLKGRKIVTNVKVLPFIISNRVIDHPKIIPINDKITLVSMRCLPSMTRRIILYQPLKMMVLNPNTT